MKNNYMISKRLLAAVLLLVYSIGFYSCQKEVASLPKSIDKARAGEMLFRKGVLLQVVESDKEQVCSHIYPLLDKLDEMRAKAATKTLFGAVNPVDQAMDDVINGIKNNDENYFSDLQDVAANGDLEKVKEVLNKGKDHLNLYLEQVLPTEVLRETQNGVEDLNREYLYKKAVINDDDLLNYTKGINKIIADLEAKHGAEAAMYAWWHWVIAAVVVVAAAVIGTIAIIGSSGTIGVPVAAAALGTAAAFLIWASANNK